MVLTVLRRYRNFTSGSIFSIQTPNARRICTLECSNSEDEVNGYVRGVKESYQLHPPPERAPLQGGALHFHVNIELASCSHSQLTAKVIISFSLPPPDWMTSVSTICTARKSLHVVVAL